MIPAGEEAHNTQQPPQKGRKEKLSSDRISFFLAKNIFLQHVLFDKSKSICFLSSPTFVVHDMISQD
jgi:hypothetical protein